MRIFTALTLLIALVAVAVPGASAAQIQVATRCATTVGTFVTNLSHGEVGWVTDGQSTANFADCEIPAGFFGEGSDPLGNQEISLNGVPLTGQTGAIDTLVEVDGIQCLQEGATKSMGTRIRGLHMEGTVDVSFNGGSSIETWLLDVYSSVNQNTGTMTVTLEDDFGGEHSSSLPVIARLVFTDPSTGETRELEDSSCELHLDSPSTPWVLAADGKFDPDAEGLPPLPGGVSVDGDGDGSADYITAGRTNFIPGVEYTGGGDGLTADSSISPWKYWLFRELYLLFKHLVWIKVVNPQIDVVDTQPAGDVFEVEQR